MPLASHGMGHSISEASFHIFVLALLVPAWFCFGKLAQKVKLPQITGYVIGGVLCGYSGLDLFRNNAQQTLRIIDHACLAIIAFTAGAELHFDIIRRLYKQVTAITIWISLASWACVYIVLTLMLAYIPFLRGIKEERIAGIVSLGAMLMVARSPASAIAVLKETGGKGPYCSLVLAVVVMKDVLVFVCFALNLEFVRVMELSVSGGSMKTMQILHPFASLGTSILLGFGVGVGLSNLASWRPIVFWRPFAPLAKRVPSYVGVRLKTIGVAGSVILLFNLAELIDAEPLLACVMAGIVSANKRIPESSTKGRAPASDYISSLIVIVNATFFGLAGTSIRLGALMATIGVAFCVWFARLAGICMGSWIGAWMGGTPVEYRRKVWQGMITQAGVAMGLAKTVASRFPTWGPDFATLMFAVILLNLCLGPPLFRHAIFTTGEANTRLSSLGVLDHPQASPKFGNEEALADEDNK